MATTKRASHLFDGVTVPVPTAQLAAPGAATLDVLVTLGERSEVDLAAVAELHGLEVATRIAEYWACARRGAVRGDLPVVARRILCDARQDTGRAKRDLDDALVALDSHPFLRSVTDALLGPVPPKRKELLAAAGPLVKVRRSGGAITITVPASAPGWPEVLGGAPMPNETRRWFRLEARHASWRDRRVRRLARLVVWAEERWPELPAPAPRPSR